MGEGRVGMASGEWRVASVQGVTQRCARTHADSGDA